MEYAIALMLLLASVDYFIGLALFSSPSSVRIKRMGAIMMKSSVITVVLVLILYSYDTLMGWISGMIYPEGINDAYQRLATWLMNNAEKGLIILSALVSTRIIGLIPIVKVIGGYVHGLISVAGLLVSSGIYFCEVIYAISRLVKGAIIPLTFLGAILYAIPARMGRIAGSSLISLMLVFYIGLPLLPAFAETLAKPLPHTFNLSQIKVDVPTSTIAFTTSYDIDERVSVSESLLKDIVLLMKTRYEGEFGKARIIIPIKAYGRTELKILSGRYEFDSLNHSSLIIPPNSIKILHSFEIEPDKAYEFAIKMSYVPLNISNVPALMEIFITPKDANCTVFVELNDESSIRIYSKGDNETKIHIKILAPESLITVDKLGKGEFSYNSEEIEEGKVRHEIVLKGSEDGYVLYFMRVRSLGYLGYLPLISTMPEKVYNLGNLLNPEILNAPISYFLEIVVIPSIYIAILFALSHGLARFMGGWLAIRFRLR